MSADVRDDRRLSWLALAFFAGAAAVWILVLQSKLSFAFDEWDYVLGRRDFSVDAFLAPHFEHIALIPVAIYKGLAETVGIESARPFQITSTLILIGAATVLFVYLRRRVPWPVALAGIVPILVLGPGAQDVYWPFQLAFSGSIAAGIGALLVLEREDRDRDLLACALLLISMSFSSLGIPFAIACAVRIALSPDRISRAWIVLVPGLLYAAWWVGWGSDAQSYITFENVARAPAFVFDGFASSIASLLGLGRAAAAGSTPLDVGRPLLLLAAGAAAYRLYRLGRVPEGVWVAAAAGVSFWFLTAVNTNPFRLPTEERYQLIGAVFVLMIAAELLRGVRFSRIAIAGVAVAAGAAAMSNASLLHQNWNSFRDQSESQRGAVSAVEIARDRVESDFVINPPSGVPIFGDAGLYLAASDDLGSPAFTAAELASTAPDAARRAADHVLADALDVRLEPFSGDLGASGEAPGVVSGVGRPTRHDPGCVVLKPDEFGNAVVALPPGGAIVRAGESSVAVAAQRYSTDFPLDLGAVAGGDTAALAIPTDRAQESWALRLSRFATATVCGYAAAG